MEIEGFLRLRIFIIDNQFVEFVSKAQKLIMNVEGFSA